jgi:glycosyltransferase involved in cell wall biosynthesis
MQLSIVIPLKNEEESLPELCEWISRVMQANDFSYEVILVDDGSTDDSWCVIEKISAANSNFKGIKFSGTMANRLRSMKALEPAKETWLLRWTPTCRIVLMKYRNSGE